MGLREETVKTEGCKLLLDVFQFVGISTCNLIPNSRGIFKVICIIKCNIYIHSRNEKMKMMML
jgi:hypothetical protein